MAQSPSCSHLPVGLGEDQLRYDDTDSDQTWQEPTSGEDDDPKKDSYRDIRLAKDLDLAEESSSSANQLETELVKPIDTEDTEAADCSPKKAVAR